MRILVDAMGGDHAPEQVVLGALDALKPGIQLVLIGNGNAILQVLRENNIQNIPEGMEICNADDVVSMEDDPASVIKKHPQSSMVSGLKMLAEGQGDAFISAGSTGALLTAATLLVKRVKGIRRGAMCPILPTAKGNCVLIDCGANAECTPEFLQQFAIMGNYYAQTVLQIKTPRVALLNIGTEETKGGALQKETYALLQGLDKAGILHFTGNIEARDVMLGGADVVVADGFTGNILLKTVEGTAIFLGKQVKQIFMRNIFTKISALFCKSGIDAFKKRMDYREVGGTAFLGICKPVIKAHGSSDRLAFASAIRQAKQEAEAGVSEKIACSMEQLKKSGGTNCVE